MRVRFQVIDQAHTVGQSRADDEKLNKGGGVQAGTIPVVSEVRVTSKPISLYKAFCTSSRSDDCPTAPHSVPDTVFKSTFPSQVYYSDAQVFPIRYVAGNGDHLSSYPVGDRTTSPR